MAFVIFKDSRKAAEECIYIPVMCFSLSIVIGERSEPPLSVELSEFSLYLYNIYIFIYLYISAVRRTRAVNARATRKRRIGRLRFNGQYNRLENGYFSSKL